MTTKRFSLRILFLVGLGALTVSAAGAGRVLSPSRAGDSADAASSRLTRGAVCFGHVDMENGITSLYPLLPGRVLKVEVQETQEVKAGAVLLRLDDDLARLRVREAQADLEATRDQLSQAENLPAQHRSKITQQGGALQAVKHRLAGARHLLDRKKELEKIQHLNIQEVSAAEDLVRELEAMERVENSRLEELKLVEPDLGVKRARSDLDAKQARLEQVLRGVEECTLKAPTDGTVLRILVNPGDVLGVQPKQPAILFCSSGRRIIRAEVEQEFASRVAVGLVAYVQDDISTDTMWHGRVFRVSDWYTHRRSILQEPFQFNDVRTLECLIALDHGQPVPRIGQRVRVTIGQATP